MTRSAPATMMTGNLIFLVIFVVSCDGLLDELINSFCRSFFGLGCESCHDYAAFFGHFRRQFHVVPERSKHEWLAEKCV